MRYWLFKSEPTTFSIDDLKNTEAQTTCWNGVRNYQVRNMMRDDIQIGDQAFFYHSNCTPPGIAGIMEVVSKAYPDPTAFDVHSPYYDSKSSEERPRWFMVDVRLVKKFPRLISLEEIKQNPKLKEMLIVRRGNRLSITPVTKEEWDTILKVA